MPARRQTLFSHIEDVAVALAGTVRECPLIAGSIRVLLEEKLLHRRRNRNHALVSLRLPTDLRLGLNEHNSEIEVQIVPRQMLDSPFRIPVSRIVENSRRSSSRQAAKNLRSSSECHEPGQRPLWHAELLDIRHGIHEQKIVFDGPTEEREEAVQLVVDRADRDARMNGMPPKPPVLRIGLHRSPLPIASQL